MSIVDPQHTAVNIPAEPDRGSPLMPRIRTIKPDAFLSESLSTVPRGTRWTFAGLWTYADDKGRARDDSTAHQRRALPA